MTNYPTSPSTPKLAVHYDVETVEIFDGHSELLDVYQAAGDSECIVWAGYVEPLRALYIEFPHGYYYRYSDVRPATFHAMTEADSPGGYFNREIRGKYLYRRLADTQ